MRKFWKVLHWFIIINFLVGILYGFFMVFFAVGGGRYPLWMQAVDTPIEIILKRRLYAIEAWMATAGLAVYLAVTEYLPRKLKEMRIVFEKQGE